MKSKVFFIKAILGKIKFVFIEILTKIKSKLTSNFLVFLSDPDLLTPVYMYDR